MNRAFEQARENEKWLKDSSKQFNKVARVLGLEEDEKITEIVNLGTGSGTGIAGLPQSQARTLAQAHDRGIEGYEGVSSQPSTTDRTRKT